MLQVQILENQFTVADSDGGIWWPSEEAQAAIQAAPQPEAEAIRICEAEPMRGEWHQ